VQALQVSRTQESLKGPDKTLPQARTRPWRHLFASLGVQKQGGPIWEGPSQARSGVKMDRGCNFGWIAVQLSITPGNTPQQGMGERAL
jgi:hypothetical protein